MTWGAAAATVAVILCWGMAWLSRRPGAWRWACAASVALALATPGPVAGMALVLAYRSFPAIYDTPIIVILAFVMRTFPYGLLVLWPAVLVSVLAYFPFVYLPVVAQLRRLDPALEDIAATLGKPPMRR